jgi:hypothetical protein
MHLWDRLLPQAEIILNLLRTSRLHPQLSAAAHFHGLNYYNKTAFSLPGCKIIAHERPSQRQTWSPNGKTGYLLVPVMHHYRFQYINITSTASARIVDTLEFFPHNSPMPQLSSTYRFLMAANDMTDALEHPHPDVYFNTVVDDTITALTTLSAIFKNNYNKPPVPELIDSPIKAAENKNPAVLIQPVLTSPVKHTYQTRSQTEANQVPVHVNESQNSHNLRGWSPQQ